MKYLKALLIVMIALFTFGSAIAQDSYTQRTDQSGQHHYRHRQKYHRRMSNQNRSDQRRSDQRNPDQRSSDQRRTDQRSPDQH